MSICEVFSQLTKGVPGNWSGRLAITLITQDFVKGKIMRHDSYALSLFAVSHKQRQAQRLPISKALCIAFDVADSTFRAIALVFVFSAGTLLASTTHGAAIAFGSGSEIRTFSTLSPPATGVHSTAVLKARTASVPLFWSKFERGTSLGAPHNCWSTGCWQSITGTDASTGYAWPPPVWGTSTVSRFQLLADNPTGMMDPTAIHGYMFNQIVSATGHKGTLTKALYSQVTQSGCCGSNPQGSGATQNSFLLQPTTETGDLYISYWIKYQQRLARQLTPGAWRDLFKWKTGTPGQDDGDYRVLVQISTWNCPGSPTPPYCWLIQADNDASSNPSPLPAPGYYWQVTNSAVPVPIGQWFKFEVFWHRSTGADGRIWMAVNGHVICDHYGPNKISQNINRIFITNNYAGVAYPSSQWLDELQIWNGFPMVGAAEPWYDPPYSAH